MEHKQTAVTPRDLEDADPLQFQHLVEKVWNIFEHQVCEQTEATKMLQSAAKTISSIGNYRKIEEDFKLGLLGEYVGKNDETLPFLATVMSHIHDQLERELQGTASVTANAPHCAMTTFLKELENKLGADDKTKNVVQEITEMANQASGNLAKGNPEFSRLLTEIGDTMRVSWDSLRDEVEKCIRHARKKHYSEKNMKHIYKRIICKGLSSAKNIQNKIDSVSASLDSGPLINTVDQMKPSPGASNSLGVAPSSQTSQMDNRKRGLDLSPSSLENPNRKEKLGSPINNNEDADGVMESPSQSLAELSKSRVNQMAKPKKDSKTNRSITSGSKIKPKGTSSANKIGSSIQKENTSSKMQQSPRDTKTDSKRQ